VHPEPVPQLSRALQELRSFAQRVEQQQGHEDGADEPQVVPEVGTRRVQIGAPSEPGAAASAIATSQIDVTDKGRAPSRRSAPAWTRGTTRRSAPLRRSVLYENCVVGDKSRLIVRIIRGECRSGRHCHGADMPLSWKLVELIDESRCA